MPHSNQIVAAVLQLLLQSTPLPNYGKRSTVCAELHNLVHARPPEIFQQGSQWDLLNGPDLVDGLTSHMRPSASFLMMFTPLHNAADMSAYRVAEFLSTPNAPPRIIPIAILSTG
ncbi:hypothetical protein CEXT_295371 [Caerostris extrusa]|uniref:Uncharacterized protein n=1 Tax=Caerostris extrusa TaxID=172846 RepID=A0AAV4SMT1_CAEEX|nr:hypothetical protein CEXT_295371 [Caerostris extrusa]